MAGKELYIQPILADSLDGVQQIAEKMIEIESQFTESIKIQSNILANTGMAQSQVVYSGSTLSGLTSHLQTAEEVSSDVNLLNVGTVLGDNSFTSALVNRGTTKEIIKYVLNKKYETLTFTIKGYNWVSPTAQIIVKDENANVLYEGMAPADTSPNVEATVNVKNADYIIISIYSSENYNVTATLLNILFDNEKIMRMSLSQTKFNSNNELVIGSGIQYTSPKYPTTAILDIPTISGVGIWNACLINGNLKGIKISIIDTNTRAKLINLSGAITDISTLAKMSGFSVLFEFGEGSENSYISSVIFRYY